MSAEVIHGATPLENNLAGVHPRLYACMQDFERLRSVIDHDGYAPIWAGVQANAHALPPTDCPASPGGDLRNWGDALMNLAMCYRIKGEAKDLAGAKHLLKTILNYSNPDKAGMGLGFGHLLHGAAVAYDWLYHDLDQGEREWIADQLHAFGKQAFSGLSSFSHFCATAYTMNAMAVEQCGLAALGGALFGERTGAGSWLKLVTEKARLMIQALGSDGISPESTSYGQYYAERLAMLLAQLKQLMGVDLMPGSDWWREHAVASLYHTCPRDYWQNRNAFTFQFGDSAMPAKIWHGPNPQLRLIANVFRDGHAQWLADQLRLSGCVADKVACLELLWYDPSVPATGPADLPTFRHFKDQDIVFMRSGWDGQESILAFKCGPHSGHRNLAYNHDPSGDHMHPDAASIALYAHGEKLLIESGYCRRLPGYENTLVLNGHAQTGAGCNFNVFEDLPFRKGKPTPFMVRTGEVNQVRFAVGDATNAYDDELGLKRFIRTVYEPLPDCWVVVDDVQTDAPATFEFMYHADRPFVAESAQRFIRAGQTGSLLIESHGTGDVVCRAEPQLIQGRGGNTKLDFESELLCIANAQPVCEAVFITILHAFPTGKPPCLKAKTSQTKTGWQVRLVLEGTGETAELDVPSSCVATKSE